jgi:hypothetical protein
MSRDVAMKGRRARARCELAPRDGQHPSERVAQPAHSRPDVQGRNPAPLRRLLRAEAESAAWLTTTGCSRAAIHFDVDAIDSNEIVLGLGAEPDGLTSDQVRRIIADLDSAVDVVGLTIAEFIPGR